MSLCNAKVVASVSYDLHWQGKTKIKQCNCEALYKVTFKAKKRRVAELPSVGYRCEAHKLKGTGSLQVDTIEPLTNRRKQCPIL